MSSILNHSLLEEKSKAWIPWAVLYILIVGTVILRVKVESTGFVTPDSVYYQEVSKNILHGLGPYGPKVFDVDPIKGTLIPLFEQTPFGKPKEYELTYFSVWPLGYPFCISSFAWLTGVSVFWSSKIINLLFLGISFFLLYKNFKSKALLAAAYFCCYPLLEIISYTWSEMGFLTFLLWLMISLNKVLDTDKNSGHSLYLSIATALAGMFFFRYAGFIFYVFTGLILLYLVLKKEYLTSLKLTVTLVFASLLAGFYLFLNWHNTGFLTGMPRAATQELSNGFLIYRLFLGLFNQLHLIKQFRFAPGGDTMLYLFLTLLQLSLLVFWKKLLTMPFWGKNLVRLMLSGGLIYLLFLMYLTFTSTIDPFDYRTLSPFSHLIYLACFISLGSYLVESKQYKVLVYFLLFFFISLLMNLPKRFLIEEITGIF